MPPLQGQLQYQLRTQQHNQQPDHLWKAHPLRRLLGRLQDQPHNQPKIQHPHLHRSQLPFQHLDPHRSQLPFRPPVRQQVHQSQSHHLLHRPIRHQIRRLYQHQNPVQLLRLHLLLSQQQYLQPLIPLLSQPLHQHPSLLVPPQFLRHHQRQNPHLGQRLRQPQTQHLLPPKGQRQILHHNLPPNPLLALQCLGVQRMFQLQIQHPNLLLFLLPILLLILLLIPHQFPLPIRHLDRHLDRHPHQLPQLCLWKLRQLPAPKVIILLLHHPYHLFQPLDV
mmetsp:Transcript_30995/g.44030  ORF Transcript_30995/g.44030 Transcript_30995/m.44030 type:complete len:278 (+) Transcript_30995:837-1670(+)